MAVALAREAMFFRLARRRRLREAPCRAWAGRGATGAILLVQTGMGAAATRRALSWALLQQPARVLVAGFCGALEDDLEVGALVQATEVCDGQGNTWPLAPCPRVGLPGRLVSVERPVLGTAGRHDLRTRRRAIAVDLESAPAAHVLSAAGVPFACLRVVSDDARAGLPEDLAAALAGERIDACLLLRAALRRPALVADLWRLARQSRLAARRLADGVEQLLRAWSAVGGQPSAAINSTAG